MYSVPVLSAPSPYSPGRGHPRCSAHGQGFGGLTLLPAQPLQGDGGARRSSCAALWSDAKGEPLRSCVLVSPCQGESANLLSPSREKSGNFLCTAAISSLLCSHPLPTPDRNTYPQPCSPAQEGVQKQAEKRNIQNWLCCRRLPEIPQNAEFRASVRFPHL